MARVGFYIDGFNFYHAVAEHGSNCLKWMCYRDLAIRLKAPSEDLTLVKMFSAYAEHKPGSVGRHRKYTAALESRGVICVHGMFKGKQVFCKNCRTQGDHFEEKETDVNIGIHLVNDCWKGLIDKAYIVTTDSDIAPAARMVRAEFPQIQLVSVCTPGRAHSKAMLAACDEQKATISWNMVKRCLLPREVYSEDGKLLVVRPQQYDPPANWKL